MQFALFTLLHPNPDLGFYPETQAKPYLECPYCGGAGRCSAAELRIEFFYQRINDLLHTLVDFVIIKSA